ncbi:hydroxymethylbilane synthase [Treponema primitia ZAS-2]|uniref:Hydroxymethylbilane synthase n=1 Tax=Treponema primitia (strain ATCC BAA-887 / DSM 12427 / ZAS-2) TaxID=545694 RepID=F5YLI6_TREPZ|nr:hydroxymethylbilane synthase [Treponema primitia]AEF85222.1 hydroxymethylbilane synthase [Treponema primitia ZAS-2]
MIREIRIGSRESVLAIAQTRLIMDPIMRAHPELSLRLVTMKSEGDLNPDLPLGFTGKALFTGTLERALVAGELDLCVHSLKDMAETQPEDLPILAIPKRGNPWDMLIPPQDFFQGKDEKDIFTALEKALPIGCSSLRRRIQLQALAPELHSAPIRGNVPTRLSKLDSGQYGALILAAAGLERLGITRQGGRLFSLQEMIPAAGQGTLAIQGRRGEDYPFLELLRDPISEEEALAERALIRTLGCGCSSPAAAYAKISGNEIFITGMYTPLETEGIGLANVTNIDEIPFAREEISGDRRHALQLAEELARRLIQAASRDPGRTPQRDAPEGGRR